MAPAKPLHVTTKTTKSSGKQNLTLSLDRQSIQKAKVLAARRSQRSLGSSDGVLVGDEEAYARAERQAKSCSTTALRRVSQSMPPAMTSMNDSPMNNSGNRRHDR
jgi:hypothetical protein